MRSQLSSVSQQLERPPPQCRRCYAHNPIGRRSRRSSESAFQPRLPSRHRPNKMSFTTGLFDDPYGLLTALDKDVGNNSVRPFSGKRQCTCPAYSRSGTRHQSHFAFELLGHSCYLLNSVFKPNPALLNRHPLVSARQGARKQRSAFRRLNISNCCDATGLGCPVFPQGVRSSARVTRLRSRSRNSPIPTPQPTMAMRKSRSTFSLPSGLRSLANSRRH